MYDGTAHQDEKSTKNQAEQIKKNSFFSVPIASKAMRPKHITTRTIESPKGKLSIASFFASKKTSNLFGPVASIQSMQPTAIKPLLKKKTKKLAKKIEPQQQGRSSIASFFASKPSTSTTMTTTKTEMSVLVAIEKNEPIAIDSKETKITQKRPHSNASGV